VGICFGFEDGMCDMFSFVNGHGCLDECFCVDFDKVGGEGGGG
jgi:hypothetical protein